jgi:pre-mRNA-splicing factor CWC22
VIKFLAHLINQRVLNELLGLQLVLFFLMETGDDSISLACTFLQECGQVMTRVCPNGIYAMFEKLKHLLHEGQCSRKAQYSIEKLFNVRKNNWTEYPGVIPELDMISEEDQIVHNFDLDNEDITGSSELNIFKFDQEFDKNEAEWDEIKKEILGEETIIGLKRAQQYIDGNSDEEEDEEEIAENQVSYIQNMTKDELLRLKEKIYLTISNSIDFEECAHKLLKLALPDDQLEEMTNMVVDCCSQERTFVKFYGLLAQRFCEIDEKFKMLFFKIFQERYVNIFNFEAKRLRNIAKLFAHLLFTDALDWHCMECIMLTEDETTASSRIFIKVMLLIWKKLIFRYCSKNLLRTWE